MTSRVESENGDFDASLYSVSIVLHCQQCLQTPAFFYVDYVTKFISLIKLYTEIVFYTNITQYDAQTQMQLDESKTLVFTTLVALMPFLEQHPYRDETSYNIIRNIGLQIGFIKSRKSRLSPESEAKIDAYSDPEIAAIVETTLGGIKTRNSFHKRE